MPVFPGDSKVTLKQVAAFAEVGYNSYMFRGGLHIGTHIDGPLHMMKEAPLLSQLPLDQFAGNGCLLDVRGYDEIPFLPQFDALIHPGDVVLLRTDFDGCYGTDSYYENHPVISESLVEFLISRKVKMVGIDFPSPDRYPYAIHPILFRNGILLLENLTNLKSLHNVASFEVMAFPIKVEADSAPVRVVARVQS